MSDIIRGRIPVEYYDSATGYRLGREKTYLVLCRDLASHVQVFRKWVRYCEVCQRMKPAPSSLAPVRPLPIATEAWNSVSMDFLLGLPADAQGRTVVLVIVDHLAR